MGRGDSRKILKGQKYKDDMNKEREKGVDRERNMCTGRQDKQVWKMKTGKR